MLFVADSMMAADGVSPATKARVVMPDISAGATVFALGSNLSDHTRLSALRG